MMPILITSRVLLGSHPYQKTIDYALWFEIFDTLHHCVWLSVLQTHLGANTEQPQKQRKMNGSEEKSIKISDFVTVVITNIITDITP